MARAENANFTKSHFFDHFAYAILGLIFGTVFGWIWAPFGEAFGVVWGTFSVQEGTRSENGDLRNLLFFLMENIHFEGRRGPDGAIWGPGGDFGHAWKAHRFRDRILVPKVTQKASI